MYLKKVDMENFKSFGGKISIPLMEGYMAITGPNGSGKSNITDAILFVLGPKSSKAMRAGKLTDLIYNGNKSSGKADYTKVTLYFDNTDRLLPWDADEVRFTRLVKVSSNGGEGYSSYFYINDQKSSLTEFDSLLARARISADGYNMVQQGDVTDITKMGNVERRRIIDGISGISSYDADIAKAQEDRAATEANILLSETLIGELEKQIDQLQKEMEVAKKYIETKNSLDLASAQLVHRQLQNETEKLKYNSEQVAKLQSEIDSLTAAKDDAIKRLADIKTGIEAKDKEIEAKVGPEYKKLKDDIEKMKVDKATTDDRVSKANDSIEENEAELESNQEKAQENEALLIECDKSISDTQIAIDLKDNALKEAKAENDRINAEMTSIGGEYKELQDRLAALEKAVEEQSTEEQTCRAQVATAEAVREECSRNMASFENQIAETDLEIKDSEWNLNEIKKEAGPITDIEGIQKRILDLKKQEREYEKQQDDLSIAIRRISDEYNKLSAEKKVSEQVRGGDAVLAVLAMRDKGVIKGIHGTVAELATAEPEYETALSVAAGGKMQAIIVDNDEVAAQAIKELKAKGFGRATFLPLNKMMEGKPRAKAIMVVKETLGYAIDLISFKQEYRAAFWYVFGDTIVVKDMTDGRRLMGGIRIVTKDGELMEASGAMTGGTLKKTGLKFGSASQSRLDEVGQQLRSANDSMDLLKSKLIDVRGQIHAADDEMRAAGKGSIKLQGDIAKLEAKLSELRDKRKRFKADLDAKRVDLTNANSKLSTLNASLTEAVSKLEAMKQNRTKVRDRITEIAPADLQKRMQAAMETVVRITNEHTELLDRMSQLKAERSGYEHNKNYTEKSIDKLRAKIDADRQTVETESANLERIKLELSALREIEKSMEAGIEDLRNEKDELVELKYKTESEIDQAIANVETKSGIVEQTRATMIIIQQSIDDLKIRAADIKIEITGPIPSEETLKRSVRQLENAINSFGNVNLRAIDQYNEKKERCDAMNADLSKLNEHIKGLDELTETLSSKKKGLFMGVYNGVNANFKAIFAELSGGGEAYMALEDEMDPFNGGLLINAKPKNGKMLRLDALSGGEKSLTALAFIFAIQEHQPSPFYVLDEVDMFLDSVNSEMVAQRVKKSSSKTQFIQVSLRKVTLAMADHLIGVTRPPNGVSKVIMNPNLAEVSKYEEENKRKVEEAQKKEGVQ